MHKFIEIWYSFNECASGNYHRSSRAFFCDINTLSEGRKKNAIRKQSNSKLTLISSKIWRYAWTFSASNQMMMLRKKFCVKVKAFEILRKWSASICSLISKKSSYHFKCAFKWFLFSFFWLQINLRKFFFRRMVPRGGKFHRYARCNFRAWKTESENDDKSDQNCIESVM